MGDLTYEPAEELAPLEVGDFVEVVDRNGRSLGAQKVRRVGKLVITTACGRQWTRSHGEWVSEVRGRKPVSWPFPSIRKRPAANAEVSA